MQDLASGVVISGGLPSDNEEMVHAEGTRIGEERVGTSSFFLISSPLTQLPQTVNLNVTHIDSSELVKHRKKSAKKKSTRIRPTHNEIPSETRSDYKSRIRHIAYDLIGRLYAWEKLGKDTTSSLWNLFFKGAVRIDPHGKSGDAELFKTVEYLVSFTRKYPQIFSDFVQD